MKWLHQIWNSVRKYYLYGRANLILKGASIGKNVIVEKGVEVKNPQYIVIGDHCFIGPNCRIEAWDEYLEKKFNPSIILGKDVRINSTCHIGCINRIEIGEQTLLGSHVFITDHSHGRNIKEELSIHPSERDLFSKGEVKIGKRCWICENVTILPGVHIGDETIIGANAVVTKDIPSRCVAAGNPAKIVKDLNL